MTKWLEYPAIRCSKVREYIYRSWEIYKAFSTHSAIWFNFLDPLTINQFDLFALVLSRSFEQVLKLDNTSESHIWKLSYMQLWNFRFLRSNDEFTDFLVWDLFLLKVFVSQIDS